MIHVLPNEEDYRKGFTVKGHADYGQHGTDIVCASASSIVRTAYNILAKLSPLVVNFESGEAYIRVLVQTDTTDVIIQGVIETLEELEGLYPENIYVEGDVFSVKS